MYGGEVQGLRGMSFTLKSQRRFSGHIQPREGYMRLPENQTQTNRLLREKVMSVNRS
jgi:hypothetical protein